PIDNIENISRLLQERFDLSKQKVVITGGDFDVLESGLIYNCIAEEKGSISIRTRKIDLHPPGTGELFTAHLHLSMLRGMKFRDAVTLSSDILSAVLLKMFNGGRKHF